MSSLLVIPQYHAVHNLYELHGPSGDDQARVLFIEGDPNTNTACLYGQSGCNNTSPGDWVSGTPFPIIESADIAAEYAINYYPTLYIVCPNRKLLEVPALNSTDLWSRASGCPVAYGVNNAGVFDFIQDTKLHEICDTLHLQPNFNLINLGSTALTSATIQLSWNGNHIQTINWTGNLGLYGEDSIKFDSLSLSEPGTLSTSIDYVNTIYSDDDPNNNADEHAFILSQSFDNQAVLMRLRTDNYGAETYWELRDESGNVLDFGGNENVGPNGGGVIYFDNGPGTYPNNAIIKDTLMLPTNGCYSIHFVDAYGDGICCNYGTGYYRLYNLDDLITPIMTGGAYKTNDDRALGINASVGIEAVNEDLFLFSVFPNPASNQLSINYSLPEKADLRCNILNALGQQVYHFEATQAAIGTYVHSVAVQDWPKGLYVIQLQIGNKTCIEKVIVGQ